MFQVHVKQPYFLSMLYIVGRGKDGCGARTFFFFGIFISINGRNRTEVYQRIVQGKFQQNNHRLEQPAALVVNERNTRLTLFLAFFWQWTKPLAPGSTPTSKVGEQEKSRRRSRRRSRRMRETGQRKETETETECDTPR